VPADERDGTQAASSDQPRWRSACGRRAGPRKRDTTMSSAVTARAARLRDNRVVEGGLGPAAAVHPPACGLVGAARMPEALPADTAAKQDIGVGRLTIHADRGSPMTAKPLAFPLAELGVIKSHSHPPVSDDNPYSESQFRTTKYRPELPDRRSAPPDAHRRPAASSRPVVARGCASHPQDV